jgi:hypothetical protein
MDIKESLGLKEFNFLDTFVEIRSVLSLIKSPFQKIRVVYCFGRELQVFGRDYYDN